MADYIYTMEIRLTPDQMKGVNLVQEIARAAGITLYLTGGAIRDIISGFTIRDLDFTVQGNPLKLQKDFERAGAQLAGHDEDVRTLFLVLPGNVRAEIGMARSESYEKAGKPPVISPASIQEDLRRRDFTVNAMALSLNEGSRGLLLDPFNGVADIEAKLLRILHNYSFVEDPSRLIRAARFAARFHWPLEERTQQRYDSAKENKYIEHISRSAVGHEMAQLAHEDDPLNVVRALEKEDWLKVLHPHWTAAKVDTNGLSQLMKTRQQMVDLGYTVDPSAAVMHFLTAHLSDKDISDLRRQIPRKDLVEAWRDIEIHAKELARNQSVAQKIKNYFTKWRQVQQRIPLPEMTELLITPQLPEYPKVARDVFMLLLDGKLRSRTETLKFLKPFAPPPPPPPPPPRRGRGPKPAAAAPAPIVPGKKGEVAKGKAKGAAALAPPAVAPPAPKTEAKAKPQAASKAEVKTKTEAKTRPQEKPAKAAHKPVKQLRKPVAKRPAKKAAPKKTKNKAKSKKR